LFALQGDVENNAVRSLALQFLMNEAEKRSDTLRQRICAGVKQAYKFQRAIYPDKSDVSAVVTTKRGNSVEVECIFSSVFKECIVKNRKQRQGLYKTLLGLWAFDLDEIPSARRMIKSQGSSSKDLSLLSFAAQILAHLPYNTASDPLFIIHHITTTLTLQGFQTLDRLAAFLRPFGLSSNDEDDEVNATEDALDRAAKSKFPSRTHEARALSSKQFDMPVFVDLCREGAALTLLLRLKIFLRENYNLSHTRCLQYDPSAKERLCEKGIATPKFSVAFDASVLSVFRQDQPASDIIDKDAVIRQYAEFRRMMRDENAFTTSTTSGSGSDGGGGGGGGDDDDDDDEDQHDAEKAVLRRRKRSLSDADSIRST
jgi:cohesin loading factor subunit SCC2